MQAARILARPSPFTTATFWMAAFPFSFRQQSRLKLRSPVTMMGMFFGCCALLPPVHSCLEVALTECKEVIFCIDHRVVQSASGKAVENAEPPTNGEPSSSFATAASRESNGLEEKPSARQRKA